LAMFARQFSTMIASGLPLVRALTAIIKQTDHSELRRVLPIIRGEVESGTAFSVALARHPMVFPPLMVGMIAAGEVSGSLALSMQQVAENYEKEARLRAKVVSALTYPVIVLILAFVMVAFMMIFVVPKFTEVFNQLGGQLPLPTAILVELSHWAPLGVTVTAVLIAVFSFWWRRHRNDVKVREFIDPAILRIPIMGKFAQKVNLARFARTFSSLLSSGVPMVQTLEIVASTAGSIVITNALTEVKSAVRAGKPVHTTLEQFPVFPPLVNQMVATGEETGALPDMLTKIAEYYEGEVETSSETLSSVLEPILLIFLAVIVGSMIVALYLPIFSIYQYIK
jgi:type IV pilus assembly protein PilC